MKTEKFSLQEAQVFIAEMIKNIGPKFNIKFRASYYEQDKTGLALFDYHEEREIDQMLDSSRQAFKEAGEDINAFVAYEKTLHPLWTIVGKRKSDTPVNKDEIEKIKTFVKEELILPGSSAVDLIAEIQFYFIEEYADVSKRTDFSEQYKFNRLDIALAFAQMKSAEDKGLLTVITSQGKVYVENGIVFLRSHEMLNAKFEKGKRLTDDL